MPIIIPKDIPAYDILNGENVFVMHTERASTQDIRPVDILILNLMPTKIVTETQFARLLANTCLQVNLTFIMPSEHVSKNTDKSHLDKFYTTFDKVKNKHFDGMVVTGAPVEQMPFEDVDYWKELTEIFEFSKTNVTSTIFVCWGAQAALYYFYGIQKHPLDKKLFGIYPHRKAVINEVLLNGIDDVFYIPQSRHTYNYDADLRGNEHLIPLAHSELCGTTILKSDKYNQFFITGHLEYDKDTLKNEYERDLNKGLPIEKPFNYFSENGDIDVKWRSTANILYSNWLNYYVYQITPFKFKAPKLKKKEFNSELENSGRE
ncbi:MAG: homoserine O-succinyltransferase [Acholeplasmatales bacterium]|nr:homoserine O-succinyltransferase [Acholeplasmatales bacterium]